MYDINPNLKSIRAQKEQIAAIIESINNPMVAAAGKPLEPAKAFIVGVRNPSGLFSIYIYLHLLQSKECLIYVHDPIEIPMESYHDTEVEALQFVESMGFMVDNVNFRNLAPEQQSELMSRMPVFYEDLEEFDRRVRGSKEDDQTEGQGEDAIDLALLEEGVIELDEVAEGEQAPKVEQKVISEEGLAKIIRLFSSF